MRAFIEKIRNEKVYTEIFCLLWSIYMTVYIFLMNTEMRYMVTNISDIYNTIERVLIVLVCIFFLLWPCFEKRCIALYAIIFCLVLFSAITIHETYFIGTLCFLLPLYHVDLKRFFKVDICVKVALLAVILAMCALGIFPNFTKMINGAYKQAFGFSHPNALAAFVMVIMLEWIVLRYDKLKVYEVVIMCVILVPLWNASASKTSTFTFILALLILGVAKLFPKALKNKVLQTCVAVLPACMAALSFILVWLYTYGSSFILAINRMLSKRILNAYEALKVYGISVFGQSVELYNGREIVDYSTQLYSVDMAYIFAAMHYGIIVVVLLLVAYYFATKRLFKRAEIGYILPIVYFAVNALAETHFLRIQYNFTLFIVMWTLMRDIPDGTPNEHDERLSENNE